MFFLFFVRFFMAIWRPEGIMVARLKVRGMKERNRGGRNNKAV